MHLKLGEVRKIAWGAKARQELDYRIVNKIMCSLEGLKKRITLTFQRYVNLDAQGQWAGFA